MAVNCDLARLVKNVSRPRVTREEVIGYYQSRYPGYQKKKNGELALDAKGNPKPLWKQKLVDTLHTNVVDKQGNQYKKPTLTRRFQTGREGTQNVQPHQVVEYKQIGAKLPYIPPVGIRITGTLCMRYLDDPCEDRSFNITMADDDLDFFLQSYELQSIVNVYMMTPADYGMRDEPNEEISMFACDCPGNSDCMWDDIKITAISEGSSEYEEYGEEERTPNKGFTAPVKRPKKPVEAYVKGNHAPVKSHDEIIAEMDAFQKERGVEE
jgi:hypothetical protein